MLVKNNRGINEYQSSTRNVLERLTLFYLNSNNIIDLGDQGDETKVIVRENEVFLFGSEKVDSCESSMRKFSKRG
jgi:hypothetical protein